MSKGPDEMSDATKLIERLRKAVELYDTLMSTVTGCTDGGCMIRTPQGMHTNGGCRCHRDSMKTQRILYSAKRLREAISVDAIEQQAARIAELEAFVREVSQQIESKPDYWSSCSQCERNKDHAEDLMEQGK